MKRYLSFMVAFAMILNLMAPAVAATSAKTYKVTVSKTSGGTVDGAGKYEEGDTVVLTAKYIGNKPTADVVVQLTLTEVVRGD